MTWIKVDFSTISTVSEQADEYNRLLTNALKDRAIVRGGTEEQAKALSDRIIQWLRHSTDFYSAPASSKYHESYEGGLVHHCLEVYNQVLDLIKIPKFSSVDIASAVFVALTHDWCKINNYEVYYKNVKDDMGNWIKEKAYKPRDNVVSAGHGPQSLLDIMLFCNTGFSALSEDEMMAIRWHMYTYDITSYDIRALNNCNKAIPLVHLIQFADQLSITDY